MNYIQTLREYIGHKPLLIPGVRALIRNDAGEVLLQLRSDFNVWGLPAGAMELGESAWQAVQREVREETGIEVQAAKLFGVYSDPKFTVVYPNGDQVQVFAVAFLVTQWRGALTGGDEETLALRFFPLDALPENMLPAHRQTLLDFQQNENGCLIR